MNVEKVPAELRERPQWVLWRTAVRKGMETKLPFQIGGTFAKSNDPTTWATFDDAVKHHDLGGYDGIGFMFSKDDPICGIDLDGCRNPKSGEIAPWAKAIIKQLDSYAEVSPSLNGVKVFVLGKSPFKSGRKVPIDEPLVSDKQPAIEIYDHLRYFAVTGKRLAGLPPAIEARQAELNELCKVRFPAKQAPKATPRVADTVSDRAAKYLQKVAPAIAGQGGHNTTFRAACILVLGFGLSPGEAYPLLAEWNQSCQPPWTEGELRHKLQSADGQDGERNYLRDARQDEWQSIEVPQYQQPDEPRGPKITTLADAALGYLEAVKAGGNHLLSLGLPEVDYALGGGVAMGELILLAARPSHGKSAVALQSIHEITGHGRKALMISEEMSALALGKRAIQYASDVPSDYWKHDTTVLEHITSHFEGRADCLVIESCRTAERAADEIRKAVEQHGVTFAVVDYAQLLGSKGNSRYEQITNTSITLRQVASQCKIVLLVLCQLNRSIEGRASFMPMMSDLKDSGQLEQDADVILFLCWPHRLDTTKDPHEYLFFVGKNRNRGIIKPAIKCRFDPSRQMFLPEGVDGPVDPFEERGNGFGEPWTG